MKSELHPLYFCFGAPKYYDLDLGQLAWEDWIEKEDSVEVWSVLGFWEEHRKRNWEEHGLLVCKLKDINLRFLFIWWVEVSLDWRTFLEFFDK